MDGGESRIQDASEPNKRRKEKKRNDTKNIYSIPREKKGGRIKNIRRTE